VRRTLPALAALALGVSAAPAHGSCAATVRYGGTTYFGSSLSAGAGRPLHGAVLPACDDGAPRDSHNAAEADTPIAARRVAHVPARLAVAYEGRAYLAEGYLPQLAGHPLHRRWARGQLKPSACGTPWHLRATVSVTPTPGPIPVKTAGGRDALLQLRAGTRVRGLDVAGYPHLAQAERVRALVRSCSSPFGGRVLETLRLARG
jgi:hypothetical protein